MVHMCSRSGVKPWEARGMKLWELAAVTGMYLGPTMDEARIQEVYADEERIRAEQLRRAKERQERQRSSG